MKTELLGKMEELLQGEDIMAIREAVRGIQSDWKAETAKERQLQLEEFTAASHEEGVEFEFVPNELDTNFQELVKTYRARIDEHGKKLAAERLKHYDEKKELLVELEAMVQNEENIGKAFNAFNSIREKWSAIGDVPGDKYHELQEKFHRLSQDFFYHINIYKTLQEHDLKINQKKKEELIERAKEIPALKSVNEIELLVKAYQREWMDIGPSPRESYKELGDQFFAIIREAQGKIQAHYDEIRSHATENLEKKAALVDKMKEVLTMEMTNVGTWNKWSEEVIKLQQEWRHTGYAPKKDNEEKWNEFRGLCDLFFQKKKTFFEGRRAEYKEHRDRKEELIAKAKELQDSSDWKVATEELKKLQEEWKKSGSADPREEQKLWQKFRSSCDLFFKRKKEHFAEVVGQQDENLALKESLLTEIESHEMTGNKGTDMAALKDFSERWNTIGFVPKDKLKEIMDRYNKALDAKYGQLKLEREEKVMHEFRSKLENLRSNSDGDFKIRRERQFLKDKMDALHQQIKQYENNMGFFTGSGAEALKKEIEKKIKQTQGEIQELKKKIELITV